MNSSTSRSSEERARQAEIRTQIALLQAQLVDIPEEDTAEPVSTPKRKRQDSSVLAPSTPSPKKRKIRHKTELSRPQATRKDLLNSNAGPIRPNHGTTPTEPSLPGKLPPSNVLSKLASLSKRPTGDDSPAIPVRSTAFREIPKPPPKQEPAYPLSTETVGESPVFCDVTVSQRDDRLALVEDLEIGPYNHKGPFDDPNFERLEPNSGIRLSSRCLSNDDMQDYLRGRYYLSPSRLYSVVRLLPDKQGYDVPVTGDWVTIAVVAERGPVKFTRPPVGIGNEDDDGVFRQGVLGSAAQKRSETARQKKTNTLPAPRGKKYVNVKLIDFGARSCSASGGRETFKGDAFLTLLLFESDRVDSITAEDGKNEKIYHGGSRGAFESMSKLKEGDVIALLNPKILRPFQRSNDQPHPISNILALTPESASSIAVIGRARDLGMCTVIKRDGKVCGGWCDKRVSDVCEWHVQHAVEKQRAGRPEFSIGTSGMSSSSGPKRRPNYDPARQWGLKPEDSHEPGTTTYVMSGHTVNGPGSTNHSLYVSETIGREGQAKAKRKLASKDADHALKALLEKDKDGMKAVLKARKFALDGHRQTSQAKNVEASKAMLTVDQNRTQDATVVGNQEPLSTHSYSAAVIKKLGFDPAVQAGRRRPNDSIVQKKLETLSAASSAKRDFLLGPRPGRRIKSGVFAPQYSERTSADAAVTDSRETENLTQELIDLDNF